MIAPPAEACRLGRRQLGRHAYEEHMPARIHAIASVPRGDNRLAGVIPVLADLLSSNGDTKTAYLCHDKVEHIYKAKGEGDHFCGYRNIQMLLSGMNVQPKSHDLSVHQGDYSILQLQSLIENAWEAGINSESRIETGGIYDTRKHIGTSEAQALFQYLGVAGPAEAFSNTKGSKTAYHDLLDYVEQYFSSCDNKMTDRTGKVHHTTLGPIYLQRPRHSFTIVGILQKEDMSRALLVFDPAYSPPKSLITAITRNKTTKHPKVALKAYQKNERYLKRYRAYEALQISLLRSG